MDALDGGEVWLDARSMRGLSSRGDWSLVATRARGVIVALEDVHAAGHDHVHGDGAHLRATATLRDASTAGLPTIVVTVITRSSARSVAAIASELGRLRGVGWCVRLARAEAQAEAASRLPSLGVTTPHVLRGADRAARSGVSVFFGGFPRCVLGPYARWAVPDGTTAAGLPCDGCAARVGCPGLAPIHRARFGQRELRALDAPVAEERSHARDALRDVVLALEGAEGAKTSAD